MTTESIARKVLVVGCALAGVGIAALTLTFTRDDEAPTPTLPPTTVLVTTTTVAPTTTTMAPATTVASCVPGSPDTVKPSPDAVKPSPDTVKALPGGTTASVPSGSAAPETTEKVCP